MWGEVSSNRFQMVTLDFVGAFASAQRICIKAINLLGF